MGAAMDDQRLVALAQEGNPDAFSLLVERHQTMVYNLALGKTGSPAGRGGSDPNRLPGEGRLLLLALPSHYERGHRPAPPAQPPAADPLPGRPPTCPPVPDPAEDPQAQAEAQERRRQLWQAIDALPEVHRTPFLLAGDGGYSYREIAKALGLEEGRSSPAWPGPGALAQRVAQPRELLGPGSV